MTTTKTSEANTPPLEKIAAAIPELDLWQPRDWPHRRGDTISLSLLTYPLPDDSPGNRPHDCENCSTRCDTIHDCVQCWKCKSTFCRDCTFKQDGFLPAFSMKMNEIVESGFGKCYSCQEPLRSMAIPDNSRALLEVGFRPGEDGELQLFQDCQKHICLDPQTAIASLVQEAEDSLKRADLSRKFQQVDRAILEYTHAINAVNYIASLTSGNGLVLRIHDILLIAHGKRAELEGNPALREAILVAYPKASVKDLNASQSESWYLSESAYQTLFWLLSAKFLVGSGDEQGRCFCIDMRARNIDQAFSCPFLLDQLRLAGISATGQVVMEIRLKLLVEHGFCSIDHEFNSFNGIWRGSFAHLDMMMGIPTVTTGSHSIRLLAIYQDIRVFRNDITAAEYTRNEFNISIAGKRSGTSQSKAGKASQECRTIIIRWLSEDIRNKWPQQS